jgi:hypothetical protein
MTYVLVFDEEATEEEQNVAREFERARADAVSSHVGMYAIPIVALMLAMGWSWELIERRR